MITTLHNHVDITPTPRILRVLGDIPFQIWQCFAELMDNSIDAFHDSARNGCPMESPEITISWSNASVPDDKNELEIFDSGPGMTLDQLSAAVTAGYTTNDPIHNLGMFGMGFNVATARLGETTRILSTTAGSNEWVGVEIDFATLIKSKGFAAPIITLPKSDPSLHGTKIIISRLRQGIPKDLRSKETSIRKQLEKVYSTILQQKTIDIKIQGKTLLPQLHCVWSAERFVMRKGNRVYAQNEIDRDLGECFFDCNRNRALTEDEQDELEVELQSNGNVIPSHIVKRRKRLRGWVGIQRYGDPNDFGIDFIRNGRKILLSEKSLFWYQNPLTQTPTLEYPKELGSTWGGRIVGEIHADFLIPTYQKDNFDRSDPSWNEMVVALRGTGPILTGLRASLDFPGDNTSPFGQLVPAYMRMTPGTKDLAIAKGLSSAFLKSFQEGKSDFQSDEKWWKAAQQADQERADGTSGNTTPNDPGDSASDDADDYVLGDSASNTAKPTPLLPFVVPIKEEAITTELDVLIQNSEPVPSITRAFSYSDAPSFAVRSFRLKTGKILHKGRRRPCHLSQDGVEIDFVFDPKHPLLAEFPLGPEQLLAIYLTEKFNARDHTFDSIATLEGILTRSMPDLRIDKASLQERAESVFANVREGIMRLLSDKATEVLSVIHQSTGDLEDTVSRLLKDAQHLIGPFQNQRIEGFEAVDAAPPKAILRIVKSFPEYLFDGNLFSSPYSVFNLPDQNATDRKRQESLDMILSYLQDAIWMCNAPSKPPKEQLQRCAHSISFLETQLSR